jgi:hypothetical protein
VLTVSQDERDQGSIFTNWLDLFLLRRMSTLATIRQVVQDATSFEDAVDRFSKNVSLAADSYFVLGGTKAGEGAVVTRSRGTKDVDVWRLGDDANATWFVLETNYDHWKPAGAHDDRRTVGREHMEQVGPAAFHTDQMWGVLSDTRHNSTLGQRAVYNSDTVYTWAGSAALGPSVSKVMVRGQYPGQD